MKRILIFLALAVSCLSAHGASFPYITFAGNTNRLAYSNGSLTWPTNATLAGVASASALNAGTVTASNSITLNGDTRTNWPTASEIASGALILEHRLTEGSGFQIRNSAAQFPSDIGIAWPGEFIWSSYEWFGILPTNWFTATGFSNPNGDFSAARFFPTDGRGLALTCNFPISGQYVMSEWVKANTSTNQMFRTHLAGTWSSDMTATPTWQRFFWTNTTVTAGSNLVVPIYTDAAGDPTDVLFWGLKVEPLNTPTPYYSQQFNGILGIAANTNSLAPTWKSNAVHFTQSGIGTYGPRTFSWGSNPAKVEQATVYAVAREYDSVSLTGHIPVFTDFTQKLGLWEQSDPSASQVFTFNGQSVVNYSMTLNDAQWHVFAASYDGNGMVLYNDDVLVATNSVGAVSPFETYAFLGGGYEHSSFSWQGDIGYLSVYGVGHSDSLIKQNISAIRGIMASKGITVARPSAILAFEGDSLTAGTAKPRTGYVWLISTNTTPKPWVSNFAVSGSALESISDPDNTATNRARLVNSVARNGCTNILSILLGANDFVAQTTNWITTNWFPTMTNYLAGARAAGFKINYIASLPCNNGANHDGLRDYANGLMLSVPGSYDKITRVDLDPLIGYDGAETNTTYYADGVHLTDAGQSILAAWVKTNTDLLLRGQ